MPDTIDADVAEVDSTPLAIVVSIAIVEAEVSLDMVVVDSVVDVVSAFFSQLVARAMIESANRADFAKLFMVLCV